MFLLGLRILTPERTQLNGGVLQGQSAIPIFTDGSKFGGGTCAGFSVGDSVLNSLFQAEIFAILKTIEAIAGDHNSNLESYMIFVDS